LRAADLCTKIDAEDRRIILSVLCFVMGKSSAFCYDGNKVRNLQWS
jgi:hypothetical protein